MPRVLRTMIPRIRKSLRERGLVTSICRSFLLPVHLFKEYRAAKSLRPDTQVSAFDEQYGVQTDGSFRGWTYLSDLDIPSPNWIDGNDYAGIDPLRFRNVMAGFGIAFEGYTFIDFGSGKGRALLLASEYPFQRILGLEFAPKMHRTAEENIRQYHSATQKCRDIQSLNMDFCDYVLPPEPSVLFFFHPCQIRVLMKVVGEISRSLYSHPRPVYIAYVAPTPEQKVLFAFSGYLEQICENTELRFCLYRSCVKPK
ncbi:MAG: class I SAM-dependent methyltransferase [Terriglobales bacterium]|jgi:SAM-dependent methyltransferase